jgi:1-acyl-sn-glycerol-3-phosphate acyltransferase
MSSEFTLVASPADVRITGAAPSDLAADTGAAVLEYGRRAWYAMRRFWWSSYWTLTVEGARRVPRRSAVLLCANHTSHLDAPAILAALPRELALRTSTAAAKDVFADYPARKVVSQLLTNALPIGRGADFSRGLRELEAVLHDRRPLILFPEGRRSQGGELLEFKPGAAMLALRTGTPIVPIHIDGADRSLPRGGHFPRPAAVRVRFGETIDPRPYRKAVSQGLSKREAYDRLTADLKAAILALAA